MPAVRAALITPLSGPLALYGRASAAALRIWAEHFAGPEPPALSVLDAHPDPVAALRRAERGEPELLFGPYGSGPAARFADATSQLVWNHGGARLEPRRNVVNVLAPASSYFAGAVEALRNTDPCLRRIGLLHSPTGFGRGVAKGAEVTAHRHGLDVARVALPEGPPPAEALLVAGRFAEELAVARALRRDRWRAVGFVGAGVDEVLAELGERREGLLGPAQWIHAASPVPDEGPRADEFVAAYRARYGNFPPYPAVQAFTAGIIAMRCVRDAAGTGDAALRRAARRLDCTTLFGPFRLDGAGYQIGHRVLTVQWQGGERVVVWPPEHATAPLRYPLC